VSCARRSVRSDADVYAGIVLAWWGMYRQGEHLEHPMSPYVIGPGFARTVWSRVATDRGRIFVACARIVSVEKWRLADARRLAVECLFTEALDPASVWWLPIDESSGVGVHFWRLVNRTIELRSVGALHAPPELQFGRFAARERRRHEE
jgi:hypothetical protein